MSNKVNHRRARGHIRRHNPHPCGRKVCGVCGPKSKVKKNETVERIERDALNAARTAPASADREGGEK